MSVKNMTWVFEHSPYKLGARLVHLALADVANDAYQDRLWLLQKDIAGKARLSVVQVQRILRQMVADGYLEVVSKGGGRGKPTEYRLLKKTHQDDAVSEEEKPHHPAPETPSSATETPSSATSAPITNARTELKHKPDDSLTLVSDPPNSLLPALPDPFEVFWAVYPRHTGGKVAARKSFDKALKRASVGEIVTGAYRFRDDPNREAQFTPHPTTWLNQGRWSDEPLPARRRSGQEGKNDAGWDTLRKMAAGGVPS